MKLDKKAWYTIGLVILGIILCFTTAKTIGIIFLVIGLVGFVLLNTGFGKKIIKQKSEKVEEEPIEAKVVEPEEKTEKENIE